MKITKQIKMIIATVILLLFLVFIIIKKQTPINIAITGSDLTESSTMAVTVTDYQNKEAQFIYSALRVSEQIYFMVMPFDLTHLSTRSAEIRTSQKLANNFIQVGYLIENKNKDRNPVFHAQKSFRIRYKSQVNQQFIYQISEAQLKRIRNIAQKQSYFIKIQITFILIIYFSYLLSLTCLTTAKKGLLLLYILLAYLVITLALTSQVLIGYTLIVLSLTALMLFVASSSLIVHQVKNRQFLVTLIYGSAVLIGILKFNVLNQNFTYYYDEPAHLGYVDYLVQSDSNQFLPDYSKMKTVNDFGFKFNHDEKKIMITQKERDKGVVNYLGHPPLYYQIMKTIGAQKLSGNRTQFDYHKMYLLSMLFVFSGFLIYVYLAMTRLKPILPLHFFIATGFVSPTLMQAAFSGINNDTLAFLSTAIFALAAFRVIEEKYSFSTFLLLFMSISLAVLTKLTAGLMVVSVAILLLIVILFKKRELTFLKSWIFWVNSLCLVPALFFYGGIYAKYQTFFPAITQTNPLGYRQFIPIISDVINEPYHTIVFFVSSIIKLLIGETTGDRYLLYTKGNLSETSFFPNVFYSILMLLAFSSMLLMLKKKIRITLNDCCLIAIYAASFICSAIVLVFQIYTSSFATGYLTGYNARYLYPYLPIAFISFGLIYQMFLQQSALWFNDEVIEKRVVTTISTIMLLLSLVVLIDQSIIRFLS